MIRADSPCHLYFDLEFQTALNTDKDGKAMSHLLIKAVTEPNPNPNPDPKFPKFPNPNPNWSHLLIKAVTERLRLVYQVEIEHVTVQDSSTTAKFSRHLIIRLADGTAFANNRHCGAFVRDLVQSHLDEHSFQPAGEAGGAGGGGEGAGTFHH